MALLPDDPPPRVAVVLPPREGFGPQSAGAIGLLQARLLGSGEGRFAVTVWGAPQGGPVFDLPFRAVAPRGWLGSAARRYARALAHALAAARPAIVEVHNRPDVAGFLAARLPASRVVLFLHNDPRGMRGADSPGRRQALGRRLAGIVCVSRFLRDQWMEGVGTPGVAEPAILPNCLDLAALPPPEPAERREKLLLFAGRMVADKGADTFVAACALALPRLPGWRAELIGADRFRPDSPETPFIARLRPAAARAGVTLAGYHDHTAVMAAFGRAAIAVLPSRWQEPFGLTALEAMASGCALVTSARGGLAELCQGVAAFADPEAPAAVAEAILAFAGDMPARQQAAALGRARAEAYDVAPARALLDRIRMDVLQL